MRTGGLRIALLLSACGFTLLAQQTAPSSSPSVLPDPLQQPLTPAEQHEREIREVDPLDRSDDKDQKEREKDKREEGKQNSSAETAVPGSLAAEQQATTPPRSAGPEVTADDADQPVQDYNGPAVLSRSYSLNRPLIPQQLRWTESLGVNSVYNTGASTGVNADGSLYSANLLGTMFSWSLSGRHYFRHDQVGVHYAGNYQEYPGKSTYNGSNSSLAIDYTHIVSRRISLNLAASGSVYSQNYVLQNPDLGPNSTIANINLGTSPNIQITDYGTKQFSLQTNLVWQQSSRLSFSVGESAFAIVRDGPGLLGSTGQQASSDVNYRLTRDMTVGAYYSFSEYVYPRGNGDSLINSGGAIFSYAFTRTMQLRLRGGLSYVNNRTFQVITVPPSIAVLIGQNSGIIDAYAKMSTTDLSGQFIKDFRGGRTATIAFAHGVSPGNGVFQTSVQESMSASFGMRLFRDYLINAGLGRDTLTAVGVASLGSYSSDYGRLSVSRSLRRGVSVEFTVEFRHFDITDLIGVQNQLRITSGVSWGSSSARLWPF